MQNTHHQGAAEPVMLGPAFQTWGSLEKLHDKSRNLPDPDTFAFDTAWSRHCRHLVGESCGWRNVVVLFLGENHVEPPVISERFDENEKTPFILQPLYLHLDENEDSVGSSYSF
ncbi:unnamed protein product [Amoebophrya sp. A120]|nr:unnamed protein product [Amoebophrya sp. A120]|eukprot:GSA120T00004617001.1